MPGHIPGLPTDSPERENRTLQLDLALWSNTQLAGPSDYFSQLTGPWEVVSDEAREKQGD